MGVKRILKKETLELKDYIKFLLEASAASCKFGTITMIQKDGREYEVDANVNVALIMPFGTSKSTIVSKIPNTCVATQFTIPGFIGSINEKGEVILGSAFEAGGKVLLIDEFQKINDNVMDAMNSMLEHPREFARHLGFNVMRSISKRGKWAKAKAKQGKNSLWVSSKFSCIAAGMYMKQARPVQKAFLSRFIPVRFIPGMDYYDALTGGEQYITIDVHAKEMDFIFRDYLKFQQIYMKDIRRVGFFQKNAMDRGYIPRILQHIIKLSAFLASLEDRREITLDDAKTIWERFGPMIVMSTVSNEMDDDDMMILYNYRNMSQQEIAYILNISPQAVSQRLSRLVAKGIVDPQIVDNMRETYKHTDIDKTSDNLENYARST